VKYFEDTNHTSASRSPLLNWSSATSGIFKSYAIEIATFITPALLEHLPRLSHYRFRIYNNAIAAEDLATQKAWELSLLETVAYYTEGYNVCFQIEQTKEDWQFFDDA